MRREIEKHKDKADDDSSAYGPWDADYKSRKAGKGKAVKTKVSKYTKKFKELFGESEEIDIDLLMTYEDYREVANLVEEIILDEEIPGDEMMESSKMGKDSPVYKALKKKSDKSRFPLSILKKVWDRGYAAWKTGHVPGTTPQQWAMARVNSFIVGGRTTEVGDKALYKQAKANLKKKKD
jgi:hypothetical protein